MPSRDDRIEELSREIAARLRPTCADLPEPDFAALVRDIARMSRRFAEIDADPRFSRTVDWPDPAATPLPAATETPHDTTQIRLL
jgi:hypothetical protein